MLEEGSVIRFGRIPFKVTKLKINFSNEGEQEQDGPGLIQRYQKEKKVEKQSSSPMPTLGTLADETIQDDAMQNENLAGIPSSNLDKPLQKGGLGMVHADV